MTRHQSLAAAPGLVLLLACVRCGGGGGGYNAPTATGGQTTGTASSPAAVSIAIVANAGAQSFNPNPSNVRMGQTVAWRNNDSIVHHIVEDAVDTTPGNNGYGGYGDGGGTASGFDGGQQGPGAASSTLAARTPGTLRYHCAIHSGMVGTLTVTQ